MAQLVASMSGVVLGGVVEVVGSTYSTYLQHLSAQLIHYIIIPPYILIYPRCLVRLCVKMCCDLTFKQI